MTLSNTIGRLRVQAGMSQEQFAALLGVSRQSVQKWECGATVPELEKLIKIAKCFDVSLDALALGRDPRRTEDSKMTKILKPNYANQPDRESYSSALPIEFQQCMEEGLNVSAYADVFSAVSCLPKGDVKKKLGDALFDVVLSAKTVLDYKYEEPSDLEGIRALRKGHDVPLAPVDASTLEDKVHGAWLGRICGCLLGKTVEGIRTNELHPFLKESGNYPMHRYILHSDMTAETVDKYTYRFPTNAYADEIDGMPPDDDTNYLGIAQYVIETYGRDFQPADMARAWLALQPKDAYFTAERMAFCNFVKGYEPPESALYKNPYREWIGAQIRGDYFGYINPGKPEEAADMAWRDASISHIKNGIYGEMFISAAIAVAATTHDIRAILEGGLAQIPANSRLHEAIRDIFALYDAGKTQQECFTAIHTRWDEHNTHDWHHTISNAQIVAASLLYGAGDYGKSICMAVETGFDTDCNGATVGSILGMAFGTACIGPAWSAPIHNTLHTSITGAQGTRLITDHVAQTMKHM